jgi:hypothetical protein
MGLAGEVGIANCGSAFDVVNSQVVFGSRHTSAYNIRRCVFMQEKVVTISSLP